MPGSTDEQPARCRPCCPAVPPWRSALSPPLVPSCHGSSLSQRLGGDFGREIVTAIGATHQIEEELALTGAHYGLLVRLREGDRVAASEHHLVVDESVDQGKSAGILPD